MEKLENKLDKVDAWLKSKRKPITWQGVFGLSIEREERPGVRFGTFHGRMLAASIDSILLLILVGPLLEFTLTHLYGPTPTPNFSSLSSAASQEELLERLRDPQMQQSFSRVTLNLLAQLAAFFGLTWWFWKRYGATPGKLLLKMRIVDAKTFAPATRAQLRMRLLGYVFSIATLGAGFMWIGVQRYKRGWHDLLAGTVVIYAPRSGTKSSGTESSLPS